MRVAASCTRRRRIKCAATLTVWLRSVVLIALSRRVRSASLLAAAKRLCRSSISSAGSYRLLQRAVLDGRSIVPGFVNRLCRLQPGREALRLSAPTKVAVLCLRPVMHRRMNPAVLIYVTAPHHPNLLVRQPVQLIDLLPMRVAASCTRRRRARGASGPRRSWRRPGAYVGRGFIKRLISQTP
jgi:hypothetical protein